MLQFLTDPHVIFLFAVIGIAAYLLEVRTEVISHWHHTFDRTHFSVQEFYAATSQAVADRKVPGAERFRVTHDERVFLSAEREYLRVTWRQQTFDICAAPYGEGFYVSWWFVERTTRLRRLLMRIPGVKLWYEGKTYHILDLEETVSDLVHACVLESVDAMTGTRGSTLSEAERAIIRLPNRML
jgi:hypothetical protein